MTLTAGEYVTLITTDASGNSSEFSNYAVATDSDAGGSTPQRTQATATSSGGLSINSDGGNDAYLIADAGKDILGGLGSFTAEFQFSSTATAGTRPLISYATPETANTLLIHTNGSGDLSVIVNGPSATSLASTFDYNTLFDGQQHAVAVTWDNTAGDWQIFVDGSLVDSGTGLSVGQTLNGSANGGELVFGQEQDGVDKNYSSGQVFNGTLYDVRLFNDVRTDAEIQSSYLGSVPHNESGLLANWQFGDYSTDGIVTESVAGNNLSVRHAVGSGGFTHSEPALTLLVSENASDGSVVGHVSAIDIERQARISALLAADPNLYYSAETDKFYKTVLTDITWSAADIAARATTLEGIAGQLGTSKGASENELFSGFYNDLNDQIWLGATDLTVEGEWRWQQAGSDAEAFWSGSGSGNALNNS
ncbi:MAG: LamG-like jellyroll fold domain-containing protein, partial [Pseudomonadota bacterium]